MMLYWYAAHYLFLISYFGVSLSHLPVFRHVHKKTATFSHFVLRDEWTELYQIWVKHEAITGA